MDKMLFVEAGLRYIRIMDPAELVDQESEIWPMLFSRTYSRLESKGLAEDLDQSISESYFESIREGYRVGWSDGMGAMVHAWIDYNNEMATKSSRRG